MLSVWVHSGRVQYFGAEMITYVWFWMVLSCCDMYTLLSMEYNLLIQAVLKQINKFWLNLLFFCLIEIQF